MSFDVRAGSERPHREAAKRAPLFLVLILAIMAIVGGGDPDFMIMMLYIIVMGMIPISQFGFIFVIWNMAKEASM